MCIVFSIEGVVLVLEEYIKYERTCATADGILWQSRLGKATQVIINKQSMVV
ncbi:hypothetical protein AALP_AA6G174700 [Arabis alpina]|uniref:Uncharacterized protein n=1 Tax=Arabis alpina TaxID=50452 RepID=A0A087GPV6_ARAAL|nr:hypothetical protein AALP_AA6G174700 [Arabis alpina]